MKNCFWVIEKGEACNPFYLYVENFYFEWTKDIHRAVHFSRRSDADMVSAVIGEDVERICEHCF